MVAIKKVLALASVMFAGVDGLRVNLAGVPSAPIADPASEEGLHNSFRDMMNDADDDDDLDAESPSSGGFVQKTAKPVDEDLEASASALTAALGSRWDGKALEADAHEKTSQLLQGIAGHQAVGTLTRMLSAMS